MKLADFYLADPRLLLVPIEHLTETGMSRAFAAVAVRRHFDAGCVGLFDAAFARYFARSEALARRTRSWPMPRLRHVAIVTDPLAVRPYAQLLNTSAWTLYDCDLDPRSSDPELVAYLLVLGDRMALSGEVASAPLHAAAYWFDRSEEEMAAFTAAARRSTRPDAAALRAVAEAIPWLRELRHESLRPPASSATHRAVPGTGLLVPRALEARPPALVERCAAASHDALVAFHSAWRRSERAALDALATWLTTAAPRLLVTSQRGRIVWDPDIPAAVTALVRELREADAVAVTSIADDLRVIDRCTRAFHAALVDPGALPAPDTTSEQGGYSYLHRQRGLIAYNLHEPGMERLRGPDLPFARAMLAARTVHEWAHLAVDAGWVPCTVGDAVRAARVAALAAEVEAVIAAAPPAIRALTAPDLVQLAATGASVGEALAGIVLGRMPDYQANLVAACFLDATEREVYVRHNVRALRHEYLPARLWPMLMRYLYEYQYLGFIGVQDGRYYLARSTWFDRDFFETGALDEPAFERLVASVATLCACYAVDPTRIRTGGEISEPR